MAIYILHHRTCQLDTARCLQHEAEINAMIGARRASPSPRSACPTPSARLADADLQSTLAVSIHAGNQQLREQLIPRYILCYATYETHCLLGTGCPAGLSTRVFNRVSNGEVVVMMRVRLELQIGVMLGSRQGLQNPECDLGDILGRLDT